jgi:hypothetical protein
LDDSWFSRTRWHLDEKPYAEYLIFDSTTVYGVMARNSMNVNGGFFTPAKNGYGLVALERSATAGDRSTAVPKATKKNRGPRRRWSIQLPIRPTALVLAGKTLFVAGPPDRIDPEDPWAAYEGRRGATLYAISAEDGRELATYELAFPPVLDGLVAAHDRLLISCLDGTVHCWTDPSRETGTRKPN